MNSWHSYPSIFGFGHREAQELLDSGVTLMAQEKVDGSQFSFGKDEDGALHAKSKGKELDVHAPQEKMFKFLKLSIATVNRKANLDEELSPEDSERVVGMANLIGQVQTMVEQSGDAAGFDAARWVAGWLAEPNPALAGECPASYMDTMEGQKLVSNLLAMMQSGAYA